jgi:HK97 gp10 family phage protein
MTKFFESPIKFAEHLVKAATVQVIAINKGLHVISEIIEADAKKQLGHLQPNVGPFHAWDELADSTKEWKERVGYVFNSDYNPLLNTGSMRDSISHVVNIQQLYAIVGSKDEIASFQEFGTQRIPPRPFIGPAFFKNKGKIAKIFGTATLIGIAGGNVIAQNMGSLLGYHQDIRL